MSEGTHERWDTPYGPNVRYAIRFHGVGEDRRNDGSLRGADRYVEITVVSPLGEARAIALAARHFADVEPSSVFREIEVANVERDFAIGASDYRDPESYGR